MTQLGQLKSDLRAAANPEKAAFFPRFFKAGPGQYAEGDKFLGVTVPNQRVISKKYKDLPLEDVEKLLLGEWHEERLTALLILVGKFTKTDDLHKKEVFDFYMRHIDRVNNWDLVDSSAGYIVGGYLDGKPEKMKILRQLARSKNIWERRVAVIATLAYIVSGRAGEALEVIDIVLNDTHDLIQKASGWMLREIGKRVDRQVLLGYLDSHAATMPRTTLRYAIEHFSPELKKHYMQLKNQA